MDTARIETEIARIVARMIANDLPKASEAGDGTTFVVTEEELVESLTRSLDFLDLGRAVLEAILTEENTDELLDSLRKKIDLPFWLPGGIVWGMVDRRLPEALLEPLLAYLDELEAKTAVGG